MRFKLSLSSLGVVLIATCMTLSAHAQTLNPKDKSQMRQLAFDYCSKASNANVCNCFADNLAQNFNVKDWTLFIADTSKSATPPSGIGESDIDNYGKKLAAAGNACGL